MVKGRVVSMHVTATRQQSKRELEGFILFFYDEAERRREMAKNSLEKYTHYYERWASNQQSRQKTLADLNQMRTVHMEKLSDIQREPESQLKFITDAWQQIVECRRVLKWTYAYGCYLPEHEQAKRQFFEYLQGEAESALERLHQCAEKELLQFLSAEGPSKELLSVLDLPG